MVRLERTAPIKSMLTVGRSQIVRPIIAAFRTRVNRPMVRRINGRDRIVANGLTIMFTNEKRRPAVRYRAMLGTSVTSPNSEIATHIPKEETTQRNKKTRMFCCNVFMD